jgi:hypothetical protein
VFATIVFGGIHLVTLMVFNVAISLLGCLFFINFKELLNGFSELYPNLTLIMGQSCFVAWVQVICPFFKEKIVMCSFETNL